MLTRKRKHEADIINRFHNPRSFPWPRDVWCVVIKLLSRDMAQFHNLHLLNKAFYLEAKASVTWQRHLVYTRSRSLTPWHLNRLSESLPFLQTLILFNVTRSLSTDSLCLLPLRSLTFWQSPGVRFRRLPPTLVSLDLRFNLLGRVSGIGLLKQLQFLTLSTDSLPEDDPPPKLWYFRLFPTFRNAGMENWAHYIGNIGRLLHINVAAFASTRDIQWLHGLTCAREQELCGLELPPVRGFRFSRAFASNLRIFSIAAPFPNYRTSSLTNPQFVDIVSSMHNIEELLLHQCSLVTDEGIVAMRGKLPHLREFHFTGNALITDVRMLSPTLRTVCLSACPRVRHFPERVAWASLTLDTSLSTMVTISATRFCDQAMTCCNPSAVWFS